MVKQCIVYQINHQYFYCQKLRCLQHTFGVFHKCEVKYCFSKNWTSMINMTTFTFTGNYFL